MVLTFDAALAGLAAERIRRRRSWSGGWASAGVAVGFDFHFGKGRGGSPTFLTAAGARYGFPVDVAPHCEDAGRPVSSGTDPRRAREAGQVVEAAELLGYPWFVTGEVVHGDKRGRELGFPTANLRLDPACGCKHGIYAVRVGDRRQRLYDGVASFGRRPMFDNGAPLLEVFLFDFSGDLYGQVIDVAFVGWIRPEMKFDSVDDLVAPDGATTAAGRAPCWPARRCASAAAARSIRAGADGPGCPARKGGRQPALRRSNGAPAQFSACGRMLTAPSGFGLLPDIGLRKERPMILGRDTDADRDRSPRIPCGNHCRHRAAGQASAQGAPFKIGLLTVKTGPLAQGGYQMEQGITVFLKERNYTLAGRKVELYLGRLRRQSGRRQDQGAGTGRARARRRHRRAVGGVRTARHHRLHRPGEDADLPRRRRRGRDPAPG